MKQLPVVMRDWNPLGVTPLLWVGEKDLCEVESNFPTPDQGPAIYFELVHMNYEADPTLYINKKA